MRSSENKFELETGFKEVKLPVPISFAEAWDALVMMTKAERVLLFSSLGKLISNLPPGRATSSWNPQSGLLNLAASQDPGVAKFVWPDSKLVLVSSKHLKEHLREYVRPRVQG